MEPSFSQIDDTSSIKFSKKRSKEEDKLREFMLSLIPVAGGVVGSVGGTFIAPGAGTVGGAVAGSAAGEALRQKIAGEDLNALKMAEEGAWGLAGAGIGKGMSVGTKLVKKQLGKALMQGGDNLALRAIRPSPSQQRIFREKTGKSLASFIKEKGLYEKGTAQVDDMLEKGYKAYDDSAMRPDIKVQLPDIITKYDEQIAKLSNIPNKTAQAKAKALIDEKELVLQQFGKTKEVGLDTITNLKRAAQANVPDKQFMNVADVAQSTNKAVYDIYKGLLDDAGGDVKKIGTELKELKLFHKIVSQQEGLGKGTLPAGLNQLLGMGTGGLIGGGAGAVASGGNPAVAIGTALAGMGLPALANNPKVIAYLAKSMTNKGGQIVEGAAKAGSGLVSKIAGQGAAQGTDALLPDISPGSEHNFNELPNADGYQNAEGDIEQAIASEQDGIQDGIEDTLHAGDNSTGATNSQPILSPGGQWKWDAAMNDWVPNEADEKEKLLAAIKNAGSKKEIDFYKAKLEMLYPDEKAGKTLSEGDKKFALAKNEAAKALQLVESGSVKTGKIPAVASRIAEFAGTQDQNTTSFKAQLATARTAARNALLGANMSDKELESYLDAIFSYSNEPKIIKAKLANFVRSMQEYEDMIAGVPEQASQELPDIYQENTYNYATEQ